MEHSQAVRVEAKAKETASWAFLGIDATLGTKLHSAGWESTYFMKITALKRSALSFFLSTHTCPQSKSSREGDWITTRCQGDQHIPPLHVSWQRCREDWCLFSTSSTPNETSSRSSVTPHRICVLPSAFFMFSSWVYWYKVHSGSNEGLCKLSWYTANCDTTQIAWVSVKWTTDINAFGIFHYSSKKISLLQENLVLYSSEAKDKHIFLGDI